MIEWTKHALGITERQQSRAARERYERDSLRALRGIEAVVCDLRASVAMIDPRNEPARDAAE